MIDSEKLAAGVAAGLMRTSAFRAGNIEQVLREAFRRGFQIGNTLRRPGEIDRSATRPSPAKEQGPWTETP